ncbi:hypothetical protein [Sphingomonas sp. 67-36]|nr:hypothetical protein [Sphingomonas sp. 67-36]
MDRALSAWRASRLQGAGLHADPAALAAAIMDRTGYRAMARDEFGAATVR